MNSLQSFVPFFFLFCWILIGFAGSSIAKKRNRNQILWFINCMLSGIFGLLVIACSNTLEYDEELDCTETDTLGWIVLVLSVIMFGVSIWYGYLAVEEYNSWRRWHNANLLWSL